MAMMGSVVCLCKGIWARRPGNPLGKQSVWYDHDFEKINERETYGYKWYDARCKRCGYLEKGWRDVMPEGAESAPPDRSHPAGAPNPSRR